MADPNEKVPTHDLSFEPQRSQFNAEGWDHEGDNQGAAMVLDKRDSTSARVATLMESGMEEKDANEQAVKELEQKLEGKTADVATYIERFSKVALTREDVEAGRLNEPAKQGCRVPFTARAILFPDSAGIGEFVLRYGAGDGSIKEVRINATSIASVRQTIGDRQPGAAGWREGYARQAYSHIKRELQRLEFHFEQPAPNIEDYPTPYDQRISDAINRKRQAARNQEAEDKRKRFGY